MKLSVRRDQASEIFSERSNVTYVIPERSRIEVSTSPSPLDLFHVWHCGRKIRGEVVAATLES